MGRKEVNRMGLKERAVETYLRETAEQRERDRKAAEEYAAEASKEFKQTFGEEPDEINPITQWSCEIHCDGLAFEARRQAYGSKFYVKLPCSNCGESVPIHVLSLSTLGYWLSQKPLCEKCSKIINAEKTAGNRIIERLKKILNLIKEGE